MIITLSIPCFRVKVHSRCITEPTDATAGDTFVIYPGELFSYIADSHYPWHYTWVAFSGRAAGTLLSQIGVSPHQAVISGSNPRSIRHYYRHIRSSFQHSDTPVLEDMESAAWLRLLLRELGRMNSHQIDVKPTTETDIERQVGQAIRYLELQYTQTVSIEELAHTPRLSPYVFM